MQTMIPLEDANDLVTASFEACPTFAADGLGSPVCSACGWLDGEHTGPVAEVRLLPRRRTARPVPKRLAS